MKKEKKYLVLVKNLILKASVGIYPKEKTKKQKVRFNISVTAHDNIKKKNDISDFVSYEDIIKNVKNVINKGHTPLIENLDDNIESWTYKNFNEAERIAVIVNKKLNN